MTEKANDEAVTFLVSVTLPEPEEPRKELLQLLKGAQVRLLGSYVVSDQTSPEQARDEFEDEAFEALSEYEDAFRETGQFVDAQLVFTPDLGETLERLEAELKYDAIVIPKPFGGLQKVLVALSGDVDFERVMRTVGVLLSSEDLDVTLLNMTEEEEEVEEKELMLTGLREKLAERGVPEENMEVRSASSSDAVEATAEIAENFDLIVLAEKEQTIRETLFGKAWELVAEEFDGPVVIVRLGDDENS